MKNVCCELIRTNQVMVVIVDDDPLVFFTRYDKGYFLQLVVNDQMVSANHKELE